MGRPTRGRPPITDKIGGDYRSVKITEDSPYFSMAQRNTSKSPNGFILEHRLVMAQHIGRCLLSTEVVHHINHIVDDNRIENLELSDVHQHPLKHPKHPKRIHKEHPMSKKPVVYVQIEPNVKDSLSKLAKAKGMGLATYIRVILLDLVKEHKNDKG
jgi:hypothetical protein